VHSSNRLFALILCFPSQPRRRSIGPIFPDRSLWPSKTDPQYGFVTNYPLFPVKQDSRSRPLRPSLFPLLLPLPLLHSAFLGFPLILRFIFVFRFSISWLCASASPSYFAWPAPSLILVTVARSPVSMARKTRFLTNPQTRPAANAARPFLATSQICAKFNRPRTASLSNQTQPLHQLCSYRSASDSSSIVSIKRLLQIASFLVPRSPFRRQVQTIAISLRSAGDMKSVASLA
jgi:hypothetical protein